MSIRLKIKQIFKKIKGSALGSVVLIGGSAISMIFALSVAAYSDNEITNQKGDSLLAYQAASAGIELGLMYYKYNNNVQLSAECENVNSNCTKEPTKTEGLPIRIYIDRLGCTDQGIGDLRDMSVKDEEGKRHCIGVEVGGTTTYELLKDSSKKPPTNEEVFDLRIWYKSNQLGDPTKFNTNYKNPSAFNSNYNYDPEVSRVVEQDDSYQIDGLEKVRSFKLHLRPKEWASKRDEFILNNGGLKPEDPKAYNNLDYYNWFQQNFCHQSCDKKVNPTCRPPEDINTNMSDLCSYYIIYIKNSAHPTVLLKNEMVPLRKPFQYQTNGYPIGQTGVFVSGLGDLVESIRLRPVNMDLQFAITDIRDIHGNKLKIDSGITHIEATGYHGSVKRKLEAKYDRKTNAFLGIFDRALYIGEGGLAP